MSRTEIAAMILGLSLVGLMAVGSVYATVWVIRYLARQEALEICGAGRDGK